jgi:DHA1 family tetracycline resistance protein-like MFS transporter
MRRGMRQVCLFVLLHGAAMTMVLPAMPVLVTDMFDGNVAKSASFVSIVTAVSSSGQFFSSSVLGKLSDDRGRKPIILVSLLCFGTARCTDTHGYAIE